MKLIFVLVCLISLLKASESTAIRAYHLERLSSLRSSENSGIRPAISKRLKSAPFPSRFFREGDELVEIRQGNIGFRDEASRAIYNKTTRRLVVIATPRDHWGIAEVLRGERLRQLRITVRILRLPEVPSINLEFDQWKGGEGAKELKLLELSGGPIMSGETLDGQLQVQFETYNVGFDTGKFSIVSRIPDANFAFKSVSSILNGQPQMLGMVSNGQKGGFAAELLSEKIQLDGASYSGWVLEEDTGQEPVDPFEELCDEQFRFEKKLPDGRVRRSLGLLPDYDRFLPRERERKSEMRDPFAEDRDPFAESDEVKALPLSPKFYVGNHPFLKSMKGLGMIDATPILARYGVRLGPNDFAVIEPKRSLFVVETKLENFAVIEKKVMEVSYGNEVETFVDLVLVSSEEKIDATSLVNRDVRALYQSKARIENLENFEGEYDFEGRSKTFLLYRDDQAGVNEITLDHESETPGKKVTIKGDGWVIVRQMKREGQWLTWAARRTLKTSHQVTR